MKKTFNINLGGIPFIIDEDAYQILYNYLENIKRKFSNSAEAEEIMQDIEARFAELFTNAAKGNKEVIGMAEVEAATAAMGKPEDIASDGDPTATQANTQSNTQSNSQRPSKRLFRNPDDVTIGGVLSGMSAYFGIDDPVWLRIAFAIFLVISAGTATLIYIILWAIIPEAKTASEKLQMRGEPVNLDSIQKEVTDAASRITSKGESNGGRVVSILLMVVKASFKVAAFFIAVLVLFILFVFVASAIGVLSFASIPTVQEMVSVYLDNGAVLYMGIIGVILVVLLPLIGVLYASIRLITGIRTRIAAMKWVVGGGFVVGVLLLVFAGINYGVNFRTSGNTKSRFDIMQPTNGTLFVQLADSSGVVFNPDSDEQDDEDNFGVFVNGELLKTRTGYKIGKPHIKLMPSKDTSFYVEQYVVSQGKNKANAISNAKNVNYNFSQTDTVLNLNTYYEVLHGSKWRGQDLYFRIAIPEGKFVRFADNIDFLPATVKDTRAYHSTLFANTTWSVRNGIVICLDCKEEISSDDWDIEEIHGRNDANEEEGIIVEENIIDKDGEKIITRKKFITNSKADKEENVTVDVQGDDKKGGKVTIRTSTNTKGDKGEKDVQVIIKKQEEK